MFAEALQKKKPHHKGRGKEVGEPAVSPQQKALYDAIESGAAKQKDALQSIVLALTQRVMALEDTSTPAHQDTSRAGVFGPSLGQFEEHERKIQQMHGEIAQMAQNIQGRHGDAWAIAGAAGRATGEILAAGGSMTTTAAPVTNDAHVHVSELCVRVETLESKIEAQRAYYQGKVDVLESAVGSYQELCESKMKNFEDVLEARLARGGNDSSHRDEGIASDISMAAKDVTSQLSMVKVEALKVATAFITEVRNRMQASHSKLVAPHVDNNTSCPVPTPPEEISGTDKNENKSTKVPRAERRKRVKMQWKRAFTTVKVRARAIGSVS
jgi:hypothetical protein